MRVEWRVVVELSFWEKARRYRRIAAVANDEEQSPPVKPSVRPAEALDRNPLKAGPDKIAAAD